VEGEGDNNMANRKSSEQNIRHGEVFVYMKKKNSAIAMAIALFR